MKPTININGRKIGSGCPPYIIAELSANHNGDIERALAIVEMAKRCGADAIKLQTYTQDTLTIDCDRPDFMIEGGLWGGKTLYELYKEAHMPWDWHQPLFKRANDLGITIFSSPFDETAADYLEELGCPAYKIASFEAIDLPLIEYVAKKGKPLIISTGMADQKEIAEAVDVARAAGCGDLVVLHCVSGYPAPAADYNLSTITDMRDRYGVLTGLSDHTIENVTAISAVALGACVIEKHVTLDRNAGGPDDSFSLEELELKQLVDDSFTAWQSLGSVNYERKTSEKKNLVFRRSIYAVRSIKKGEKFSKENVRSIRPGFGLPPKEMSRVLGSTASCDIDFGQPILESSIELK